MQRWIIKYAKEFEKLSAYFENNVEENFYENYKAYRRTAIKGDGSD